MKFQGIVFSMGLASLLVAGGTMYAESLSKTDDQFLTMAAKTDMTEAHEGEMAESQADRSDVKELAKTIVRDHTDSYHQLTELANKTGASIPKGIDIRKDHTIVQLVHLKGASFDRQFAKDEIAAHRQAIAAFKREAEHGQNADLKAYATKMIPILEKHLHLAEDCAKPTKRS
jgi:putative membrane protein